jgi:hypothetical protein
VEENEYRETYEGVNALPCVFQRGMLARCCDCSQARRLYLAEREAVACNAQGTHIDCATLLDLLHDKARFVLQQSRVDAPLPHAKELRVQCGGLSGVAATLASAAQPTDREPEQPAQPPSVDDVQSLVREARRQYGQLRQLPLQDIIQTIARFQSRRRRRADRSE